MRRGGPLSRLLWVATIAALLPAPCLAQSASPSPTASAQVPFFSVRPNAGPKHDYTFYFWTSTDTKMDFKVIAHVLNWPPDAKHEVRYHVEVNGKPLTTRTVEVDASDEFEIAETFDVTTGPFTTQIVIESPVSRRGRLYKNILACRPAIGRPGNMECWFVH